MSSKIIAYYRVSTAAQGASGLGLEAQNQPAGDFTAPLFDPSLESS